MTVIQLSEEHALEQELVELEQLEKGTSARRRKIHERINAFPSEFLQRQEREVSDERRALQDESMNKGRS